MQRADRVIGCGCVTNCQPWVGTSEDRGARFAIRPSEYLDR